MPETAPEHDLGPRSWLHPSRNKILAVAMFTGSLLFYRCTHWRPLPALILAYFTAAISWLIVVRSLSHFQMRRDARRGLAVREWRAIRALGNCAEISARDNFNTFSRTLTRDTDDDLLMGYVTILVCLMSQERLRMTGGTETLSHLAVRSMPRWLEVIRQHPDRLRYLLHAASAYEKQGFPPATWENIRGMAALAGVLRTTRLRSEDLRFDVARRYSDHQNLR